MRGESVGYRTCEIANGIPGGVALQIKNNVFDHIIHSRSKHHCMRFGIDTSKQAAVSVPRRKIAQPCFPGAPVIGPKCLNPSLFVLAAHTAPKHDRSHAIRPQVPPARKKSKAQVWLLGSRGVQIGRTALPLPSNWESARGPRADRILNV